MLFFHLFPIQELVTAIILLYIVPLSCGILYHFMFYSHVLSLLSNINLKTYCNLFYTFIFAHSGSVLVLLVLLTCPVHISVQIS